MKRQSSTVWEMEAVIAVEVGESVFEEEEINPRWDRRTGKKAEGKGKGRRVRKERREHTSYQRKYRRIRRRLQRIPSQSSEEGIGRVGEAGNAFPEGVGEREGDGQVDDSVGPLLTGESDGVVEGSDGRVAAGPALRRERGVR